eukprot:gene11543-4796_t
MTDDILLNLDIMNKVLKIDKKDKLVTFEAGIRIKHLNEILDKNGLALPNLGSINEKSYSGINNYSNPWNTFIKSFEIIDGEGNVHFVSKKTDEELFNAGRISLGALGIDTKLTIQVEEACNIEKKEYLETVPLATEKLDTLWKENDFLKYWYFPYVEKMRITTYKKTKKEIT